MTSIREVLSVSGPSGAVSIEADAAHLLRYAHTVPVVPPEVPPAPLPTPTRNSTLPFRRGGFSCLVEALDYAAQGETGLNFFDARGRLQHRLAYADLQVQARRFARRLAGAGIRPGERLVIVAATWPGFCVGFFGAQYAGVLAVPVPVPVGIGAKDSYVAQLHRQIAVSGASAVLAPDELAGFAAEAAAGTWARLVGSMTTFEALPEAATDPEPLGAGDRCYIQYSSGSTRAPVGVDILQDRLMANIDGSIERQGLDADDAGVSWLPLYHDMGLIGFVLAPMCAQRSVDLLPPGEFARRPLQWLSLISRRRATITYSPSFGYDLVTRRAEGQSLDGLDLSSLKLAGIGADMIQPDTLRRFADAFAGAGFDARAFMPSYGMAELCVGFSFAGRFEGMRTDHVGGREFVSCGRPMAGHQFQVRGEAGLPLADHRVGRIFVHGPSVMPGYYLDQEATARVLSDGWLDTGDLGYALDSELVVTGRAKDLIIVNGRNIWPQDIEWAVEALPRLRRGDACAFSLPAADATTDTGAEEVVVLVQAYPGDEAEHETLVGQVRQAVREVAGVVATVVLVSRRDGFPMTSSGKLSRSRAKADFVAARAERPTAAD